MCCTLQWWCSAELLIPLVARLLLHLELDPSCKRTSVIWLRQSNPLFSANWQNYSHMSVYNRLWRWISKAGAAAAGPPAKKQALQQHRQQRHGGARRHSQQRPRPI